MSRISGAFIAALPLALAVLSSSVAGAEDSSGDNAVAAVAVIMDLQPREVEEAMLSLGPDAVPNLRLLSATTQRILGMAAVLSGGIHDPGQTGAAASLTEVQEALAYFGGHGAAAYLVLGLASPDVQVNVLTARAIAGLDATTRRDHTSLLIAALVDALDRWPIVWGSEAATADYERREPLWRVLSDMLAMETERGAYGRIRAGQEEAIKTAARRWLAEHLEPLGEQ